MVKRRWEGKVVELKPAAKRKVIIGNLAVDDTTVDDTEEVERWQAEYGAFTAKFMAEFSRKLREQAAHTREQHPTEDDTDRSKPVTIISGSD